MSLNPNATPTQIVTELRSVAQKAWANARSGPAKMKTNPMEPNQSNLQDDELLAFNISFNRAIRAGPAYNDPVYQSIFLRHRADLLLGLLIAKTQMQGQFTGTAGKAGIVAEWGFRAGYWGKGDSWRGSYISTGGSMQNWVHSGSTQLGGVAGNPVLFGENVVFVVLGWGAVAADTTETILFQDTIDNAPQPVTVVEDQLWQADVMKPYMVREFDTPRILGFRSLYEVQALARGTVPASEWARPIGVVYTTANILQENDLGAKTATELNNLGILNIT